MTQTLKFKCPNCGSGNTKRLPMIYKGGLSYYTGRGTSSGSSWGKGGFRVSSGSSRRSGTRQTALSMEASPGFPLSLLLIPVLIVLAFFLPPVITFLAAAALVVLIVSDFSLYSEKLATWGRTWRCLRCGQHFVVVPAEQATQAAPNPGPSPAPVQRYSDAGKVDAATEDKPQISLALAAVAATAGETNVAQANETVGAASTTKGIPMKEGKDFTQYSFRGHTYGKGRLVLALVRQYAADHPGMGFASLREAFPDTLQASSPIQFSDVQLVVARKDSVAESNRGRFFFDQTDAIELTDGQAVVSREWNRFNISNVMARALALGYEVGVAGNSSAAT